MLFVDQRLYDGEISPWRDRRLTDTTDLDPAIKNGGVIRQRSIPHGAKRDLQTGLARADQGRRIRPDEAFGKFAYFIVPAALDVDAA